MLIHIGYHKTGTTWLQSVYFQSHPDLAYIAGFEKLWRWIIAPDDFAFDPESTRAFFQPGIAAASGAGRVPVVSTERLSGNPHSGGYDSKRIADRLCALFPGAKILIVVRRQLDMAVANYKQYVRMGGICTLREYLLPPDDGRIPLFRSRFLEYHFLARYYADLFGREHVRVLAYEGFRDDPSGFLAEIAEFAGLQRDVEFDTGLRLNESLSDFATALKRHINRWHGGDSLYPVTPPLPRLTNALFGLVYRLDRTQLAGLGVGALETEAGVILGGRFSESNRALAAEFGLDLAKFGYDF